MGVVFCKKLENMDVFCKKKWKMEGVFLQKSGPFLNPGCIMYGISIFLFYILLIWGVRTHPTPLPTGLCRPIPTGVFTLEVRELD